ncbi:MAG: single-stranded DNA-binding protein [bacterium]|nr:single-stranded DNA-binding protein [bacterium]MDT8366028.1 single-stranded DNA-binding protein [bacterium]
MANYNRVILMGNLTRDPELRYTPNGSAVASFSIAVNRRYKVDNEKREETSFFDIVFFGKPAEIIAEYMKKGRPLLVEGRLQQRRWETDEGQKRSKVEVVGENFQFMGGRDQDNARPAASEGTDDPPEFDDSDIPF